MSSFLHFFWNMIQRSASKSLMSICFPYSITFGCFRTQSQPTWLNQKPRFELWGSASVSLNLWCWRWSRTQTHKQFWPTLVNKMRTKISNHFLALNDLWVHKRWAPMGKKLVSINYQKISINWIASISDNSPINWKLIIT